MSENNPYAASGVDVEAGDLAVELMKSAVQKTHGPEVFGGVGGFAGLFDVSALKNYDRPLLASSTDGVGTKVAIAQAIDKHDTIGQDLVGMVIDDIIVVGAKPLAMTDYIACGKLVPERIADIVRGIALGCQATGTALVGGETAEHPGLLGPDDYDVAGAAVGVVDAKNLLGPERVRDGDVALAMASSGLHSNGFSLVRKIMTDNNIAYTDSLAEFGGGVGEALLEPTRLYTKQLVNLLEDPTLGSSLHALSHITGGGIAANLARVLPAGAWLEVDRSTWSPEGIFRILADMGKFSLADVEGTWNLGLGMVAFVAAEQAEAITEFLEKQGERVWKIGSVSFSERDLDGFQANAKGVQGGAVRLVNEFRD